MIPGWALKNALADVDTIGETTATRTKMDNIAMVVLDIFIVVLSIRVLGLLIYAGGHLTLRVSHSR